MKSVRIDLPVLLPEIPDARDACVHRLQAIVSRKHGIKKAHVVEEAGRAVLCAHYDPDTITVDEVQRLAEAVGAEVTGRYGHQVFPLRAIAAEDAGRQIEEMLVAVDGVIAASVNLPAQVARVEFERARFRHEDIAEALRGAGFALAPETAVTRSWYARHRELAWSLAGGALLAIGFSLERVNVAPFIVIPLFLASYVFGAYDLVRHATGNLRTGRFVSTSTC